MTRTVMAFLFCLASSLANAQDIDWRIIEQEWKFIKQQTQAPEDLGMPPIFVTGNLPPAARMMFQYPTQENPQDRMVIMINPKTLQDYDREMIAWGLGHELTHYAMLLQENNWRLDLDYYTQNIRHHCHREFMRITKELADLIYTVYHDERAKYQAYHQVQRSCVDQPYQ